MSKGELNAALMRGNSTEFTHQTKYKHRLIKATAFYLPLCRSSKYDILGTFLFCRPMRFGLWRLILASLNKLKVSSMQNMHV